MDVLAAIPVGYCQCGCGQRTKIAPYSHARLGYVKGQPHRYVRGHRPAALTDPVTRFMAKVDQTGECWIWMAGRNEHGYGSFNPGPGSGMVGAHRWAYEHFIGPIPAGQGVLHRCDVPACVNPAHLFVGDQAANMDDCKSKGRLAYAGRGGESSFVGVWFDKRRQRWVAHIGHDRRHIIIGRFTTELAAAQARDTYVRRHGLPHQRNLETS